MGIHPPVGSLELFPTLLVAVLCFTPWCCVQSQSPTHANIRPSSCIPSCYSKFFFGVCLWIIYVGGGQRSAAGVTPQVPPTLLLLLLLFKRVSH